MARLVTDAEARAHLRLPDVGSPLSAEDLDLAAKLDAAEALVLAYVTQRLADGAAWAAEVDLWSADPIVSPAVAVPEEVHAAVLVMLGALYRYRGDDEAADQPKPDDGMLPPFVRMLLGRLRDPAIA